MTPRRAGRLRAAAIAVGALAAAVVVVCVTWLVVDHSRALAAQARATPRLEDLQERARGEAEAAAELNQEQKQQADATLERGVRQDALVSILIAAAVLSLVSAKGAHALAGWRAPALKTLEELRREAALTAPPEHVLRGMDWPAPDLAEVDAIVAREGTSREAAIPILNALLARHGYLPDEALRRVCATTEISPAQIEGNSSFYANFRRSPVGRHVLRVCHGTACHVAGSRQLEDELRRHLKIAAQADTDPGREFTVDRVACVGCCSLAPVMMAGEWTAGRLTPDSALRTVDALREGRA